MSAKANGAAKAPVVMDTVSDDERRIAPRKILNLKATVELPGGALLESHTVDISQTGIGLFSPKMLQPEQDCKLSIELMVCGTRIDLRLVGRVCYSTQHAVGKHRIGMRFVGVDKHAERVLNELLG